MTPRGDGWEELRREVEALPVHTYKLDPLSERVPAVNRAAVLAIVDRLAAARGELPETCSFDGCTLPDGHDGDHNGWWADPAARGEPGLREAAAAVVRASDAEDFAAVALATLNNATHGMTITTGEEPPEWHAMLAAQGWVKQAVGKLRVALSAARTPREPKV